MRIYKVNEPITEDGLYPTGRSATNSDGTMDFVEYWSVDVGTEWKKGIPVDGYAHVTVASDRPGTVELYLWGTSLDDFKSCGKVTPRKEK